nr:MAG TPA: hypothetical protein [Caudoviricetes sp.]
MVWCVILFDSVIIRTAWTCELWAKCVGICGLFLACG